MADEEVEEVEVEKTSKLPAVLGAVAVFILGGGAGFGGAMLAAGDKPAEEDGELSEAAAADGDAPKRVVHSLGLFTVNLRGSASGARVLRMEIGLETDIENVTIVEDSQAALRDTVITVVSDYNSIDLEGVDGKTRLRDELLTRANKLLPSNARVHRVYFTQFVVQ